jgi:hypothetical protein
MGFLFLARPGCPNLFEHPGRAKNKTTRQPEKIVFTTLTGWGNKKV